MATSERALTAATFALLGIVTLLYSVLGGRQPLLLGMGVAFAFFVVAWFVYNGDANRQTFARATISLTLIYGVFTLQLPVAVVAACVVYLTAWLTGSNSPFDAPDTQIFPVESAAPDESNYEE